MRTGVSGVTDAAPRLDRLLRPADGDASGVVVVVGVE